MRRAIASIAAAGLAVLLAGTVEAQAPRFNYRDAKAVEAWLLSEKIDQGGVSRFDKTWVTLGAAPEGFYLSKRLLDQTHNRGPNFTIVVNRLELWEPIVDGNRQIRSIQFDYLIDCLHHTSKRTVLTSYTKHNLLGSPKSERIDEPFAPFDAMLKPYADEICRAIGR